MEVQTDLGSFEVTLEPAKAPKTVRTILAYCRDGFYEGTLFHLVMPGFLVQGGGKTMGPDGSMVTKAPTYVNIPSEAGNGLTHVRGAVALSHPRGKPHAATCQFYVVLKDSPHLDGKSAAPAPPAKKKTVRRKRRARQPYTVFGKVTKGLDVVEKIAALPQDPEKRNQPNDPPVIKRIVVREGLDPRKDK
jgi:cyclophilin family peptidyl-prolyl cis-trans isomerase